MDIFDKEYRSVSDTFLLPLTGLSKNETFPHQTYMFWNEYNIENYQLILVYDYTDEQKIKEYLLNVVFPVLDSKGYVLENYDTSSKCILILDISEWALDIELCLAGRYSKLSREAKTKIEAYHKATRADKKTPAGIFAYLNPNKSDKVFDGKTALEFVSQEYGMDLESLQKVGELGIKYDKVAETLMTDFEGIIFEHIK